jgi:hypothetical protein
MSQKNTTPETSTYVLGRGKMYFSEIMTNGNPAGWHFVGNVPEVTATVESENYEHFRSTQGLRTKDLDIIIQQSLNWTASLENMEKKNISLFFAAEDDTDFVNPAITGFTAQTLVADGELVTEADGGLWYQIYDASTQAAMNIDGTKLTLMTTEDSPVELDLDVDYTLDSVTGKVFFLDTDATAAVVSSGDGVTAALTDDASAGKVSKLGAGTKGETNVAIRFELINAQTDVVELMFDIHKAGVTANGDAGFVSDEVAQLPISIAVEQNDAFEAPMTIYDLRG